MSSLRASIRSNRSFINMNMMPGWDGEPDIVCVFPQPVAPYANTVELKPSNTPGTSSFALPSKTVCWVADSSKTWSKQKRTSFVFLTLDYRNMGCKHCSHYSVQLCRCLPGSQEGALKRSDWRRICRVEDEHSVIQSLHYAVYERI